VHDADAPLGTLLGLQTALVARGDRARLVRRAKNTKLQLENLAEQGFTSFAFLGADAPVSADALDLRPLD